jgi:hypothetical protein
MPEEDPIDALAGLNPVPDDTHVDIPKELMSIPDAMRRETSWRTSIVAAVLLGLVLGWLMIAGAGVPTVEPRSACVVVSGQVVSDSVGVCLAGPDL